MLSQAEQWEQPHHEPKLYPGSCFITLRISLENEERDRGWQEVGRQKSFLQSGFPPVLSQAEPQAAAAGAGRLAALRRSPHRALAFLCPPREGGEGLSVSGRWGWKWWFGCRQTFPVLTPTPSWDGGQCK